MKRSYLAIPVSSLLAFSLLVPAFGQTDIDNPQGQVQTAATPPDQRPKLSEEDLARLYLIRKQYREAQDLFHKLTVEQPKNAVYWNELGITFHNQSELELALKCYQKSAKLDSRYPDAHNNAGTVFYEQKKYGKAIRAYKKAIALREDSATFYLNMGYAYFGEKNYPESIASFRKALQIDPDTFDAARSRTGTLIQDRSVSTERARFYFLLAKSFAESGDVDRSIIYLRKARDEGYQDMQAVKTDPAFAAVMQKPEAQELVIEKTAEISQTNPVQQ
jgi:tetratricopeptide (TPR) repeat protein